MKYTGFCIPSFSLTKAALTTSLKTNRYRNSCSPRLDGLSNGREERYAFRSSNACWHSFIYSNDFLNVRKKGRHLSVALETNLFNAVILLFRLCTSLTVFGGANSIMSCIFSGLISYPFGIPWSQELSYCHPKHTLVWIQLHVVRSKGVEGLSKVAQVVVHPCAFYQHVIHVNLHIPSNLVCEHSVHQPLVHGSRVLKSERHHFVAEESVASDK